MKALLLTFALAVTAIEAAPAKVRSLFLRRWPGRALPYRAHAMNVAWRASGCNGVPCRLSVDRHVGSLPHAHLLPLVRSQKSKSTASAVLQLTDENFDAAIAENDPLLVAFTAPWCVVPACRECQLCWSAEQGGGTLGPGDLCSDADVVMCALPSCAGAVTASS